MGRRRVARVGYAQEDGETQMMSFKTASKLSFFSFRCFPSGKPDRKREGEEEREK